MLSPSDIADLTAIRRDLHRSPEVSGEEEETARRVVAHLRSTAPDEIVTGLGGHGVAAVYSGAEPGPTILIRSELDALPIEETDRPHKSVSPGTAHLCGHDGHSTILLGVARLLCRRRPARGRVVLMFQPAEETGAGGPAVVADPRFADLRHNLGFSLHNMPGLPFGYAGLTTGAVSCASRGMALRLKGHPSHAAEPQNARSPRQALAELMIGLPGLGRDDAGAFSRVTVTHVGMGEPVFGITPGDGTLFATLRTGRDETMDGLVADVEVLVQRAAASEQLSVEIAYHDVFRHTENAADAVAAFTRALDGLGMRHGTEGGTMLPSEDFSAFAALAPSAMLYLGAGETHPVLHHPAYDFPDALIPIGAHLFERVVRDLLG